MLKLTSHVVFLHVAYAYGFSLSVTMAKIKNDCEEMNVSKPTISVALTMISIPLSMILWIINILFRKFSSDSVNELDGNATNLIL